MLPLSKRSTRLLGKQYSELSELQMPLSYLVDIHLLLTFFSALGCPIALSDNPGVNGCDLGNLQLAAAAKRMSVFGHSVSGQHEGEIWPSNRL